jgi:hypothetical protein
MKIYKVIGGSYSKIVEILSIISFKTRQGQRVEDFFTEDLKEAEKKFKEYVEEECLEFVKLIQIEDGNECVIQSFSKSSSSSSTSSSSSSTTTFFG